MDPRATECAWCGATLPPDRGRLPGRALCERCGVATTDPWPSDETLTAAYEGWYRPVGGRFLGAGDALLRRSRGALALRLEQICPPGPVLDVGAGDGSLVDAIRARGRTAVGLERVPTRPDIRAGDIMEVEEREWSAVVFWHSLEHLRAPGAALAHATELLREGGALVVAAPNAASLQARSFGDRWLALDLPRHLVHMPAAALLRRLRELGLDVTRVSYVRGGQVVFGWLHGLVGSVPGTADLYDAVRRPEARSAPVSRAQRAATLAAGVALLPVAAAGAAAEIALRRGGSVYVEAIKRA
jgi:2-polyprenyl-3-methyl-5-hydroxy-6-metoxy-1,4-benzoquinol methylase